MLIGRGSSPDQLSEAIHPAHLGYAVANGSGSIEDYSFFDEYGWWATVSKLRPPTPPRLATLDEASDASSESSDDYDPDGILDEDSDHWDADRASLEDASEEFSDGGNIYLHCGEVFEDGDFGF